MIKFSEFKPRNKGLEKVLGGLEAKIMDVVWSTGRSSVRDVYERLRPDQDLAYTTVMTVMTRLAAKGLLNRERVDGTYYYEPAMSREEFGRAVAGEVLDGLFESFSKEAIAHLVSKFEDSEDLERLAQIIEERRKEKRG